MKKEGSSPRIFSDDKCFSNAQALKKCSLTSAIVIGSADVLNYAVSSGLMTPEDFSKYPNNYKTKVAPFIMNVDGKGGYSPRLDKFLTTEQVADFLKNNGAYQFATLPAPGRGLNVVDIAGLALDIETSSDEAATL